MKTIFEGTNERINGLQVVDTGLLFEKDLINAGMNSFVFSTKNIAYKDIFVRVYLENDKYAWSKADVVYRDIEGKTVKGGYFTSLNLDTNEFAEHYTI